MNRKKRLMCLCLSAMLLLSLIPANVLHAAEPKGPDKEIAYISIFIDGKNISYMIFASDTEYNEIDEVKGMSYNKKTNTLTIKNYSNEKAGLVCNGMGADFKINIEGKNKLLSIESWGSQHNGNLTLMGKGSLDLNTKKKAQLVSPILIHSEDTASALKIKKTVTLNVYTKKASDYSILIKDDSKLTAKSKAIILENTSNAVKSLKKKIKSVKCDKYEKYMFQLVYYKNQEPHIAMLGDTPGTYDMIHLLKVDGGGYEWGEYVETVKNPEKAGYKCKSIGKVYEFYIKGGFKIKGQK